ncbi:DUF1396 domain-containing protein [Streptomyces pactum]|uniref:DUF1396 domain-containing protein n=1 Tax=Streptomyces pactum TaxID=68249 RepID=A0ABS0NK07_9ACTN|nr:DUF1396 domain-containing protein [Streptomyces pactum]MBH5335434.1 DUF1396 domain-containing protein [Streptomyces pactum]
MGIGIRTGRGRGARAAGAALIAAVLCAGVAGCGSAESGAKKDGSTRKAAGEPGMSPVAAVRAAAEKNEKFTSFRYLMSGRSPEDGRVEGEGAMSLAEPHAMSLKLRVPDQGPDAAMEIRLIGDALYLDGGPAAAAEMDGKRWMKFDKSLLGGKDGKGAPGGAPAPSSAAGQADRNPAGEAALLSGSEDVKRAGEETIDGVRTTRYSGTITLDQMRESIKGEDAKVRERREKKLAEFEDLGVEKLSVDMWVATEEGHTKRFRMRGKGDQGPLDMTVTFLDVNKPVTVSVPPAGQTVDVADLAGGGEG